MKKKYSIFLLILITLPFRLYHLNFPIGDATSFRQAQTATVALNFYKHGINLLQTELDIFGIGKEKYLTLEFPLYEAIVALFYKLFFFNDIWGKVVSIIAGFIGAWFLYEIVLLIIRKKFIAAFSSFFFLFAPLNMFYQRNFMIEPTVVALLLAGLYYSLKWIENKKKRDYFIAIILLSLGFIHKGVYGPFLLLPILTYYVHKYSLRQVISLNLFGLFLTPLLALFIWQHHVNYINTINGQDYFTTSNNGHLLWNFGTLADRLSWSMWQPRLDYIFRGIFLKPGLFVFLIGLVTFFRVDKTKFLFFWLISQIIYFFTFFRIQSHNYYQMIMIPPLATIMAIGLYMSMRILKGLRAYKHLPLIFIISFSLFYIYRSWLHSRWDFAIDWKAYGRVEAVGMAVKDKSYGIFVTPGYDWNSVYTYIIGKKMFLAGAEDVTPDNIAKWKELGYSFIVLHRYGMYPDYLKEKKPGHSLNFLENYQEVLSLEDFKVYFL